MTTELTPGGVISGQYRLVERIGSGAFGDVWRAEVVGSPNPVAVKFLTYAGPDAVRRFTLESDILTRLRHPNIVNVLDRGQTPAGVPYLVMEYVAGETLGAWMQKPHHPDEIVRMILQLAEALKAAHREGVVHRDLKPANVLVRADSQAPCVLDFGIAKLVGLQTPDVTKTGQVLGTPGYMSPEQLLGSRHITASADMYALGVILYEMLERRPLYDGETPLAIAMQHVRSPPPPMASTGPLSDLAMDLLSKDPLQRPTATAVVDRLSHGTSMVAEAVPRRSYALIGVLLAAIVVAGIVVAMLMPETSTVETVAPVQPAVRANPLAAPPDVEPEAVAIDAGQVADLRPLACPDYPQFDSGAQTIPDVGRGAWVHLPKGYSPARKYPLVVFFHDAYQEPRRAMENIDFDAPQVADYVFLFPEGNVNDLRRRQWRYNVERAAAIDSMNTLSELVCIDTEQLFVIGHGRGGDAVRMLRCESDWNAVATLGHRLSQVEKRCPTPAPEIIILPNEDPTAPVDGSRGCNSAKHTTIDEQVEMARERNKCRARRKPDSDGCVEHRCKIPLKHCEIPGSRRWTARYNQVFETAVLMGRCPNMRKTRFAATDQIFEFFSRFRTDSP